MPHISAKPIRRKVFLKISDQLLRLLTTPSSQKENHQLVWELLTSTERIMLAKRLALVFMINRGDSIYKIGRTLKVSSSTAARFERQMEAGRYRHLLRWLEKNQPVKTLAIDKVLDQILFGILPPRVGKNRQLFSRHHHLSGHDD